MNRQGQRYGPGDRRVPHVRGDEPGTGNVTETFHVVFPTCVGMNRRLLYQP